MLTGKYWITKKAAVNVTCSEHALYARNYMLRLLRTDQEILLNRHLFTPIPQSELADHRKRRIPNSVLNFLSHPHSDARLYAIQHYGWIRTRGEKFYLWQLTEKQWLQIRRCAAFWNEQQKVSDSDALYFWEMKTLCWFTSTVSEFRSSRTFKSFQCTLFECAHI